MKKNLFYYLFVTVSFLTFGISFVSCSSDDDESSIDTTPITIGCGKTLDISSRGTNITSNNTFVASVKEGKLVANHIGTAMLLVGGKSIPVTVQPTVSYIEEPCTQWGSTKAEVRKAHKSGIEMEPVTGSSDVLMYRVETIGGKAKYLYAYIFENGRLQSSSVLVPVSEASKLTDWLTERFFMLPISNETEIAAGGYNAYSLDEATIACAI